MKEELIFEYLLVKNSDETVHDYDKIVIVNQEIVSKFISNEENKLIRGEMDFFRIKEKPQFKKISLISGNEVNISSQVYEKDNRFLIIKAVMVMPPNLHIEKIDTQTILQKNIEPALISDINKNGENEFELHIKIQSKNSKKNIGVINAEISGSKDKILKIVNEIMNIIQNEE